MHACFKHQTKINAYSHSWLMLWFHFNERLKFQVCGLYGVLGPPVVVIGYQRFPVLLKPQTRMFRCSWSTANFGKMGLNDMTLYYSNILHLWDSKPWSRFFFFYTPYSRHDAQIDRYENDITSWQSAAVNTDQSVPRKSTNSSLRC